MRDRYPVYSWDCGLGLRRRTAYGFAKSNGSVLEGWIKIPFGAFLVRQYGLTCLSVRASTQDTNTVVLTPHQAKVAAVAGKYGLKWIESS